MQNEEITDGVQVEQTEDQTEGTEVTESEEITVETQGETTDTPTPELTIEEKLAKAEAEAAKYKRLFNKTQKGSAPEAKKPMVKAPTNATPPSSSVEETVLRANGMPSKLLEELKAVAKVRNIGLIDAQTDPIFLGMKEKFEKEQKAKESSLPASRGSGSAKPKKDFNTPGLTRDEHKAMFYADLK